MTLYPPHGFFSETLYKKPFLGGKNFWRFFIYIAFCHLCRLGMFAFFNTRKYKQLTINRNYCVLLIDSDLLCITNR